MSFIQHFQDDYPNTTNTEIIEVPLNLNQTVKNVTRVEIIDEKCRSYVNWNKNNKVQIFIQDQGKTMKVVISKNKIKN